MLPSVKASRRSPPNGGCANRGFRRIASRRSSLFARAVELERARLTPMGSRVEVHQSMRGRVPEIFAAFQVPGGFPVARSRTTRTDRLEFHGLPIHLKRTRLPLGVALRAALRNSFVRPSRAEREFRALETLSGHAGDLAPMPVAFGERRRLGLLRESFLATLTVPAAETLAPRHLADRDALGSLGRFLGRLMAAGFCHGSLYARNVLALPGREFRVVDLDRARFFGTPDRASSRRAAAFDRDLARLDASLPGLTRTARLRILSAISPLPRDRVVRRRMVAAILAHRAKALRRLARRGPSPSSP